MPHFPFQLRLPAAQLLTVTVLAMMYLPASRAADPRQPIVLDETEQAFVLNEMRQYVVSLQQILSALANDDPIAVGQAARSMGMQAMRDAPSTLMGKLPMEFRRLGMPTHKAFDEIADAAESGEDNRAILGRLGAVLNNCVACHASYRLSAAGTGD